MQAVYVEQTKMEVSVSRDEIVLCGCMCVDMGMQPKRERLDIKKVRLRLTGQSEMPVSALCSAPLIAVKKIQVDI